MGQSETQISKITVGMSVPLRPSNKRGIISTYSAVYDPLGMLVPFVIRDKVVFQALCNKGKDWDDPLDKETTLSELGSLDDFIHPRYYNPTALADDA